ncbi:hypothetical protein HKBW3S34_02240, partial [Candidatus Hakubella thermalkaliphila]
DRPEAHDVALLLSRLTKKRWPKRLHRGLYLIVPFSAGVDANCSVISTLCGRQRRLGAASSCRLATDQQLEHLPKHVAGRQPG